ncbi:flagellar basal body P-ring protein FlgI [Balneolaceae bacterium]|nr:flagellar basal body P-ring protein FlgI [Balneolaceae bacterium]
MKKSKLIGLFILFIASLSNDAQSQQLTKISDLVYIQNAEPIDLIGYGLVTGLERTGDRVTSGQSANFTVQSISNMLENFGINVDPSGLRTRNVAAVMVTARLDPYSATGSRLDVTISSLGDASSLQGGVLLLTPLMEPNSKTIHASAQGPILVGGVSANNEAGGSFRVNQSLTGTIPNGAVVSKSKELDMSLDESLKLVLRNPNYTNARSMVEVVNDRFDQELATIVHAGLVEVNWPDSLVDDGMMNIFTSFLLEESVEVQNDARVVINERTGTIVAGGAVIIDEVMISHGNLRISTTQVPVVSQPGALSTGETVILNIPQTQVSEDVAESLLIPSETTVGQLSDILNTLNLTPRDIISIFQSLDRAGVLRGELIVL